MPDHSVTSSIGIIGGVGPYARLDLVKKIFDQTVAYTDQEHLPLALLSLPSAIPDRTAYRLGEEKTNPGECIAEVALQLERMEARVAAIACNTAHANAIYGHLLGKLREVGSPLKMLHLVDETIRFLQTEFPGRRAIGVLSTTGAYRLRLYAQPLQEAGYRPIVLTPQMQTQLVHPAVYHPQVGIKATSNPVTRQARQWLEKSVRILTEAGAEAIVLGCTEIPLAITEPTLYGVPLIDPAVALARALIREVAPDKLKAWGGVAALPAEPCQNAAEPVFPAL